MLEPLLPEKRKSVSVDDRRIMNAILYVLRIGIPWREPPEAYGPCARAYSRFNRWTGRGILRQIFARLVAKSRDGLCFVDSTVTKAHRVTISAEGGRNTGEPGSAEVREPQRSTRLSMEKAGR